MWWPQIRRFRTTHRVIVYDMRGHGRSGAPDDADAYSAAHLGQDLVELLDHLAVERCRVVGFSMGGGPAMALALGQPRRVERLVLADVGSGAENPWAVKRLAEVWIDHARTGGMDAMADNMLLGEFFKTYARRNPRARRHMRALITQNPLVGMRGILAGMLARRKPLFRMRGTIARIAVPTLVLAGEHDYVCHKAARLLADTIPGAATARVPGAGHMSPLEAADDFHRLILDFMARSSP
jgi:3-oxoadipate enol-lactonase